MFHIVFFQKHVIEVLSLTKVSRSDIFIAQSDGYLKIMSWLFILKTKNTETLILRHALSFVQYIVLRYILRIVNYLLWGWRDFRMYYSYP